jgi:hypothetical protein
MPLALKSLHDGKKQFSLVQKQRQSHQCILYNHCMKWTEDVVDVIFCRCLHKISIRISTTIEHHKKVATINRILHILHLCESFNTVSSSIDTSPFLIDYILRVLDQT